MKTAILTLVITEIPSVVTMGMSGCHPLIPAYSVISAKRAAGSDLGGMVKIIVRPRFQADYLLLLELLLDLNKIAQSI